MNSQVSNIQLNRLLPIQADGSPLPFIRGEGQGEGLLVDARVHGDASLVRIRASNFHARAS